MNILIQIVNGLFTFAAVYNLPVRCRRLWKLYKEKTRSGVQRRLTIELLNSGNNGFTTQSAEAWVRESELIFDRLEWSTKHVILQSLLWNSLFQIINQVFRCIYYSYQRANTYPGNIFVNVFFPLAILASVIAALTQAIAEKHFRERYSLGKKPNNFKKTLIEFWHNLWKDQTEGQKGFVEHVGNAPLEIMGTRLLYLRQYTVDPYNSQDDLSLTIDEGSEVEDDKPRKRGRTLQVPVVRYELREKSKSLQVPRGKVRVNNQEGKLEKSLAEQDFHDHEQKLSDSLVEKSKKYAENLSLHVEKQGTINVKITGLAFAF